MEVRPGLGVDGENVGPRLGEGVEELIDRRDHQMDVERLCRVRTQRLHDGGTDGEVRHKMAVHHVDMDPVGAGLIDCAHFFPELCEIGGEDRRSNDQRTMHFIPLIDFIEFFVAVLHPCSS